MSVLRGHQAEELTVGAATRAAVVRWTVPASALAPSWRVADVGEAEVRVIIEVDRAGGASIRTVIRAGEHERAVGVPERARMTRQAAEDGDWLHVEALGVLLAVIRERDGAIMLARLGLWKKLGVAGGRYALVVDGRAG